MLDNKQEIKQHQIFVADQFKYYANSFEALAQSELEYVYNKDDKGNKIRLSNGGYSCSFNININRTDEQRDQLASSDSEIGRLINNEQNRCSINNQNRKTTSWQTYSLVHIIQQKLYLAINNEQKMQEILCQSHDPFYQLLDELCSTAEREKKHQLRQLMNTLKTLAELRMNLSDAALPSILSSSNMTPSAPPEYPLTTATHPPVPAHEVKSNESMSVTPDESTRKLAMFDVTWRQAASIATTNLRVPRYLKEFNETLQKGMNAQSEAENKKNNQRHITQLNNTAIEETKNAVKKLINDQFRVLSTEFLKAALASDALDYSSEKGSYNRISSSFSVTQSSIHDKKAYRDETLRLANTFNTTLKDGRLYLAALSDHTEKHKELYHRLQMLQEALNHAADHDDFNDILTNKDDDIFKSIETVLGACKNPENSNFALLVNKLRMLAELRQCLTGQDHLQQLNKVKTKLEALSSQPNFKADRQRNPGWDNFIALVAHLLILPALAVRVYNKASYGTFDFSVTNTRKAINQVTETLRDPKTKDLLEESKQPAAML